ncbi:hypothetical protein FE257_006013 [Aspergillus nanangensis]|uniref:Protein kinase domain-containing protein n=1 Tax=Aspergillus nanangensis TaxID=2582783 RepID=A0AAD4CQ02_ASPNN|nr:hypothetical protein FE257_006013 [Aspergillus nanangensis]
MVNCQSGDAETIVEDTQLIDLENAAYLPKGRCIKGMLAGNDNWRSPEAHFKGELNKPTDMFAFGAVRQVSYFGDQEGMNGLLRHVGDDEINCHVLRMLWDERTDDHIPYISFSVWPDIDPAFRDLIGRLMNLDPAKRLTAPEVLRHPWFMDV